MEPTDKAVIRLPQYTGRNGVGPPYAEWLMRLQTVIREKDLQNAIKFVEQGENIIRPIPQNSTGNNKRSLHQRQATICYIVKRDHFGRF